ncbi:RRP15-like protein [Glandiceps talaboti]
MAASTKAKTQTRKTKSFVEVTYDSGSEADVESDIEGDDNANDISNEDDKDMANMDDRVPENGDDPTEGTVDTKSGWADAMSKILGKQSNATILSKDRSLKKKLREKEEEEVVDVRLKKTQKRNWEEMARVRPKVTEKEHEKSLQRIATRGVVQLFNAVKKQQKTLDKKLQQVGPSERKRGKVMASMTKGDFVDLLKGTSVNVISKPTTDVLKKRKESIEEKEESGPAWSILRDDFMMGAKMKDWDKESDSDEDDKDNDSDDNDDV